MKIRALVAAAGLAFGLLALPQTASAGHCNASIFILSGAGVEGVANAGNNLGFYGCQLEPEGIEVDTNLVVPPMVFVGWAGSQPSGGTITISGVTHGLTWINNEARGRWESQPFLLGPVPAPMTTVSAEHGGQSTIYTRVI